jgi:hypothetical protein
VGSRTATQPDSRSAVARAQVAMVAAAVVGIVLRWWDLAGPGASFDEMFTGTYSHLPLGDLSGALRAEDSHPPLDYLVRHWFGAPGDTFALRLPSAIWATFALLAVLWWMWERGWFGVVVVAITSLSSAELLYAHQARMYAFAVLAGTLLAIASERWLDEGSSRWRWLAGVVLTLALFDHASALFLVPAIALVPGRRSDGEAWRWRATAVAALAIWAVLWGPSFLDQIRANRSSWIPLTTAHDAVITIGGLTTLYAGTAVVVTMLLAVGWWFLRDQDHRLAWVWVVLFVVPAALAVVVGLQAHILLTRTLAIAAWAPPVALAALIERARRRSTVVLALSVVIVAMLVVPSVKASITYDEGTATLPAAVADHVVDGDAVVFHPAWLAPEARWSLGAPRHPEVPAALQGLNGFVYVVGGGQFDGRVWVLQPDTYGLDMGSMRACDAPVVHLGQSSLQCFEADGA